MVPDSADNFHALVVICNRHANLGAALARLATIALPNIRLTAASPDSQTIRLFATAQSLGCTHVIAISADVEFTRDALLTVMHESRKAPAALIVGRASTGHSTFGFFDRVCNMLLRLETGHRLRRSDGPRIYPVQLISAIDPTGMRDFSETELLVRSTWARCPIVIAVLPETTIAKSSRSIRSPQMLRELAMHARLIIRALSGLAHPKYSGASLPAERQSFWRMFWRWLNPFDAWRELRQGGAGRNEMAVGLAVGAFIGNMPTWFFHTALSLYVARRLHLNPLAVMTGSHISAPPMGPFLIFSAMWLGHVILHHTPPTWENITPFHGKFWANAPSLLLDWTLGALIVGTGVAIIVYLIANFLFRFVEKRKTEGEPVTVDVGATHS